MARSDPEPFPWQRVMNIGLGLLQLPPEHFWSMTLPELKAAVDGLFANHPDSKPLARVELRELMQRFPD